MTAYINTLPSWEQALLSSIELKVSQLEFLQKVATASVLVGSDGSVQGPRASFAWVMSDKDGNRLAQCNGPAYGAKPVSYRAEGYGILSILRFFFHLKKQWHVTNKFAVVCDNETMVKRANEKFNGKAATPNSTLEAEWDLLAEIWTTLQELDDWSITWVKGHQDDKKPYANLDLKAQLNIDADALANQYITDNPNHPYQQVPLLPVSGVQLNLPIGTITHKLKRELRVARTAPGLQQHLCTKFNWTAPVFDNIDWESFRRAMNRLDKHRVTLTKHVNDIVPVGRRVHRYDPKYPKSCITCGIEEETASHLLECPQRAKRRNTCMQALRQHFQKENNKWDAPLELQELMFEGIKSVLEGRDPATMHCAPSVAHIAAAQTAIGWEELFRGRLASDWKAYQTTHLGTKATKKVNGQTWSTSIAQLLLQQWHNLWIERNGERHGTDKQSKDTAARRQAVREVEQLYDLQGCIRPSHN